MTKLSVFCSSKWRYLVKQIENMSMFGFDAELSSRSGT